MKNMKNLRLKPMYTMSKLLAIGITLLSSLLITACFTGPNCEDESDIIFLEKDVFPYRVDSTFRLLITSSNGRSQIVEVSTFQWEFIAIVDNEFTACETARETYHAQVRDSENNFKLHYFLMADVRRNDEPFSDEERSSISIEQNGQLIFSSPFTQKNRSSSHPNRTTYRSGRLEWSIDADSGLVYAKNDSIRISLVP